MRTLILAISTLFCVAYLHAQTNYYATTKTFNQDGYIYQCDVRASGFVTLYNKSNKLINVYPVYKNTGESFVQTEAGIKLLESDTWTRSKRFSIVNAAFSDSEKQMLKGHDFYIIMYINSSTGRVDEVSFEFHKSDPFATIPVSVYRKIETEIKKDLWFTLTTEGKMLSYIFYCWAQEPK
ncbi:MULTISPECIES: DUF5043 domain-containing protein [Bacteroides]|uniref:DUF5043 domain-containing protein n=1 Tax=Bacteroides TaxID=816 RepID=UPI000E53FC81|nr:MULTISPECIES: DUF5043 domain-containing protein [Bacteroides]RHL01849.1 DUF5043 domain-containing protein [Bacteroides sp. AF39-11AC]